MRTPSRSPPPTRWPASGVRVEVIEWDVHQILGIGSFAPPDSATQCENLQESSEDPTA